MFTLRPALRYLLIVCAVFLLGGALFMLIYSSKVLVDFNDVRRFVGKYFRIIEEEIILI